jgi:hypothetical protein
MKRMRGTNSIVLLAMLTVWLCGCTAQFWSIHTYMYDYYLREGFVNNEKADRFELLLHEELGKLGLVQNMYPTYYVRGNPRKMPESARKLRGATTGSYDVFYERKRGLITAIQYEGGVPTQYFEEIDKAIRRCLEEAFGADSYSVQGVKERRPIRV